MGRQEGIIGRFLSTLFFLFALCPCFVLSDSLLDSDLIVKYHDPELSNSCGAHTTPPNIHTHIDIYLPCLLDLSCTRSAELKAQVGLSPCPELRTEIVRPKVLAEWLRRAPWVRPKLNASIKNVYRYFIGQKKSRREGFVCDRAECCLPLQLLLLLLFVVEKIGRGCVVSVRGFKSCAGTGRCCSCCSCCPCQSSVG